MTSARLRLLAWIAVPVLLHFAILSHLWFNAPVADDYGLLAAILWLQDSVSPAQWLGFLFGQHNEHRIAIARLVAWASVEATGRADFRLFALVANVLLLGVLALAWAQFRQQVTPLALAAAAWILFHWGYYDAALQGVTGISNIGVIVAAFACLHFAMRDGRAAGVACLLAGVVAAGTMGSGLLALPLAAAGCAMAGRWRRAALVALVASAVWFAYFQGFVRPPYHPSPALALSRPVETVQLFLVVAGGLTTHVKGATVIGVAALLASAWLVWRGLWRTHPAVVLWIAFLFASAAAAAVGRVGLGVSAVSRYAVPASALLAILVFAFWAHARPSGWKAAMVVLLAAATSLVLTASNWAAATAYSRIGRQLAKAVPAAPGAQHDPYYGVHFPDLQFAADAFLHTEARRIYIARLVSVHPIAARTRARVPGDALRVGRVDEAVLLGNRIRVSGWSDIDPREPGQVLAIFSPGASPVSVSAASVSRGDLALAFGSERLLYAGFRLELEFATQEEAARALPALCVFAELPGGRAAVPERANVACATGQ